MTTNLLLRGAWALPLLLAACRFTTHPAPDTNTDPNTAASDAGVGVTTDGDVWTEDDASARPSCDGGLDSHYDGDVPWPEYDAGGEPWPEYDAGIGEEPDPWREDAGIGEEPDPWREDAGIGEEPDPWREDAGIGEEPDPWRDAGGPDPRDDAGVPTPTDGGRPGRPDGGSRRDGGTRRDGGRR